MSSSILIVDDEVDACRNMGDILSDMGHEVELAHDGRTAIEKLGRKRFDVALLDLMMPEMDGTALYAELKQRQPEIVAVLTTAYPGHPRAEAGLHSGIWRIVPKPVDLGRLLSTIDEALQLPVVLVVDDDADLCSNLWDLLWEKGFRVAIAHDVKEATELLRDDRFKLVLIDMQLPDGEGTAVIDAMREIHSHARTMVITGKRTDFTRSIERLQQSDVDAVCYKPFDVKDLLASVERLGRF